MSQWGKSTLWDAAADGNLELCKKRLENNQQKINSADAQGRTPLSEAARWGHLEVVAWLIENGADPKLVPPIGVTPLHFAAMNGQDSVVEYFIKSTKLPVDLQDKAGDSPLMLAAGNGKVSTVRLLLSLGANPDLKNRNNRSAKDLCSNAHVSAVFTEGEFTSPTHY